MDKKIETELKELAKKIEYGKITVDFVCSKGKISKAILRIRERVILFDTRH